ncbi:uncharacterized protein [Saccopteryx leptura]|uniref:uncharacterized protein isoform X3 n=1 Tax=Saccopteryx leptura TaxID=249018 RepID=UPI00339CBA91
MEGHSSPCRLPEHRRADTLEIRWMQHFGGSPGILPRRSFGSETGRTARADPCRPCNTSEARCRPSRDQPNRMQNTGPEYRSHRSLDSGCGFSTTDGATLSRGGTDRSRIYKDLALRSAGRRKDTTPCAASRSIGARTPLRWRRRATTPFPPHPTGVGRAGSRAFSRSAWNMLPEIMKGLGLVLLAALLCSEPADGLWCQFCTAITNFSHCTARECLPTEKVCASVRITDLKHSSMPVSAAHLSSSALNHIPLSG